MRTEHCCWQHEQRRQETERGGLVVKSFNFLFGRSQVRARRPATLERFSVVFLPNHHQVNTGAVSLQVSQSRNPSHYPFHHLLTVHQASDPPLYHQLLYRLMRHSEYKGPPPIKKKTTNNRKPLHLFVILFLLCFGGFAFVFFPELLRFFVVLVRVANKKFQILNNLPDTSNEK